MKVMRFAQRLVLATLLAILPLSITVTTAPHAPDGYAQSSHALSIPAVQLDVGFHDANAQAFSDYLENKLVDQIFRAQAYTFPSTLYVGLSTAACSDTGFGTEVTGGSYARVAVTGSLANWAGTQSAGSTTASTDTGGQTSNNNAINFPTPSAGWGTVTHWFIADASSSGNLLFCASLTTSKTINSGDSVSFAAGALTVTVQ